ncbi:MAG: Non-specific serine/threonine protein kinase [Nocardia sp.]|nr:hypothetical protein [Nocardia sp.]MCU1641222.1 Non-specific serine/threonine protein kinase [Nocardia sp.]
MPVYWVHLARLPRDAGLGAVEDEILAAVIDGDFSGRSARQTLIHAFGRSDAAGRALRAVLVLDNCEHVLDRVGQVVAELLHAIPGLSVLATSRTATGWVDEHIMPIPPLRRGIRPRTGPVAPMRTTAVTRRPPGMNSPSPSKKWR